MGAYEKETCPNCELAMICRGGVMPEHMIEVKEGGGKKRIQCLGTGEPSLEEAGRRVEMSLSEERAEASEIGRSPRLEIEQARYVVEHKCAALGPSELRATETPAASVYPVSDQRERDYVQAMRAARLEIDFMLFHGVPSNRHLEVMEMLTANIRKGEAR